jgi:hypothetical protein
MNISTTQTQGDASRGTGRDGTPVEHTLKSWPQFFEAILGGSKTHDLRRADDRDFRVGDSILLREFPPEIVHGSKCQSKNYVHHFRRSALRSLKGCTPSGLLHSEYCKDLAAVRGLASWLVTKVDELMALCDRLEAARVEREATRDRFAASVAMLLPAPVRFSTTNCWPSRCDSHWLMRRAQMSVGPPAQSKI